MPGFSLQHHILEDTVTVLISIRILLERIRRNLPLHDSGLECFRPDIIDPVPALQILLHQFPVEENDRHIIFFRHIDDRCRLCPVDQIHTDHIAAGI